ncbi:MAG: 2-nitropropane dioxygenase, partial [Burkholderiales bacterium]|nr:2-nitropropane dioxygenase [Burkholderiales bacterium]
SLRIPVIGAPMFLVSGPRLVVAQCKAGIIGAFPALNARTTEQLDQWLMQITAELKGSEQASENRSAAPFGVNLNINLANVRLEDDLAACVRHKVPLIFTSLGSPVDVIPRIHAYGGIVLHDVSKIRHAHKAIEAGVDGLVLLCAGAGGHTGSLNPFSFVTEVRRFFEGLLMVSGGITHGASVAAVRAMGADCAYMGTRFIATPESMAPDDYKQMVVNASSTEIVQTALFSGAPANYLAASLLAAGLDPKTLPLSQTPGKFTRRVDGPRAWRDVRAAGHGVGNIDAVEPAACIVDRLEAEFRAAIARMRCHG